MKFIISSFSWGMFDSTQSITVDKHELTEEEFRMACQGAISHVGHEDISNILNLKYNKDPVHARPGDTLLYANYEKGVLKFYCLKPRECESQLYREEEIYVEEEMI
jgi:hypothetical protein